MSTTAPTFHIDSDPAPDVQLVHTDTINRANRLAATIEAPKRYAMHTTKKTETPPLVRTGQGDFTRDYNPPPPPRIAVGEGWALALMLGTIGMLTLAIVLKLNGVW